MKRLTICVCTSNAASAEPRAPRHAVALAQMSPAFDVVFLDCLPRGEDEPPPESFASLPGITCIRHRFPHRRNGAPGLAVAKLGHLVSRGMFSLGGVLRPSAVSTRAGGLAARLRGTPADVYMAHTIDTLLPAWREAVRRRAALVFDAQEFNADMGEGQSALDREIARRIESRCLPACSLVLASSDRLADALAGTYGITRPLALYNAPPRAPALTADKGDGFSLYWRNATIGLGQRGLGEALQALTALPSDIRLHLQGRMPSDGGRELTSTIASLGLGHRVVIHPPYRPHEAVAAAAAHTVGLCLERGGVRNHELTVSNKIFDYLMAGLAVIASDLPGLRDVVERSGGGLLFEGGSATALAAAIRRLYDDRALLRTLAAHARSFALREGNRETEMLKLQAAFTASVAPPWTASSSMHARSPSP